MKIKAKSKSRLGRSALALPLLVCVALGCTKEREPEAEVAQDPVAYVGVEGAIMREFSNFATVEFRGFSESTIQMSSDFEGMKGKPFSTLAVTANDVDHVISDKHTGNGSLEFDGQEIRGVHFVITAPWQVVAHTDRHGHSSLEKFLEAVESREE